MHRRRDQVQRYSGTLLAVPDDLKVEASIVFPGEDGSRDRRRREAAAAAFTSTARCRPLRRDAAAASAFHDLSMAFGALGSLCGTRYKELYRLAKPKLELSSLPLIGSSSSSVP